MLALWKETLLKILKCQIYVPRPTIHSRRTWYAITPYAPATSTRAGKANNGPGSEMDLAAGAVVFSQLDTGSSPRTGQADQDRQL